MTGRDLGERGVALALVLWLVVLLGAVAAAVVTSTRSASSVLLNARARTVARYAAESGIVAGAALLNHSMVTEYTPARQALAFSGTRREFARLKDVPLGDARFSVALINLSGRLDLNRAAPEALVGLFSQFTSPSSARAIVDALQDWRDHDDLVRPKGGEAGTYARAGSRFVPRNAPLTRLDELRRLLGMSESLALAVEPYVTVNGDMRVDVNAAPEPVLKALPELGPSGARVLLSRRSDGAVFTSVAEVQSLLGPAVTPSLSRLAVAPSRLLLVSRGWLPGHPLSHEIQASYAIVGRSLLLQSWRERDL
jgi:general secretion pathway protein K